MVAVASLVLSFLCYSVLGWLIEGSVLLVAERRLVNSGFLTGPVVPIYGVGALAILWSTADVRHEPLLVFCAGVVLASAVEFATHWSLQRIFGIVLWDYSGRLGSVQGRVCLVNSLGFGVGALAVVYLLDPFLQDILGQLDPLLLVAAASASAAVLLVDWGHSAAAVLRLRPQIQVFEGSLARLRVDVDRQLASLGSGVDRAWAQRRIRLLRGSRRALARLEAAFPRSYVRSANTSAAKSESEKVEVK